MTDIPAHIADYLQVRHNQQMAKVSGLLEPLTAREISLIRDAAVMGFVRGMVHAGPTIAQCPPDSDVLAEVLYALTYEAKNYKVIRGEAYEYSGIKP